MARKIERGVGLKIAEETEKGKEAIETLQRVAKEKDQERKEGRVLDHLKAFSDLVGPDVLKELVKKALGEIAQEKRGTLLAPDQVDDIAKGESESRVNSQSRTEYQVDPNNKDRVLAEITTHEDGGITRVNYTYNDAGKLSQMGKSERHKDGTEYKQTDNYVYDRDGNLTETHDTRSQLKEGLPPMGWHRDMVYLSESDPRLSDPQQLKALGSVFSYIEIKNAAGKVVESYGDKGFDNKDTSANYARNSTDKRTAITYDFKGRELVKDVFDGGKKLLGYAYSYKDNPDGSYIKTTKHLGETTQRSDVVQEYDSRGNLISEHRNGGKILAFRTYTPDGKLQKISQRTQFGANDVFGMKPGWHYTEYTYNKDGRQDSVTQKEALESRV